MDYSIEVFNIGIRSFSADQGYPHISDNSWSFTRIATSSRTIWLFFPRFTTKWYPTENLRRKTKQYVTTTVIAALNSVFPLRLLISYHRHDHPPRIKLVLSCFSPLFWIRIKKVYTPFAANTVILQRHNLRFRNSPRNALATYIITPNTLRTPHWLLDHSHSDHVCMFYHNLTIFYEE